jgi:exodeoxyribonuclease V alpha subunit
VQTLDIVRENSSLFEITTLTAHKNWQQLAAQAIEFNPDSVVIADERYYKDLSDALAAYPIKVYAGNEAVAQVAAADNVDVVVNALVGYAGLLPTVAAIKKSKKIALANKETLVVAGSVVMKLAEQYHAPILPIDSEHSAIFQCLVGERSPLRRLIVTCSGGSLRDLPIEALADVTPEQALRHPQWTMGAKITIDSSTLVNKGFEVIEAAWLFGLDADKISKQVDGFIHSGDLGRYREGEREYIMTHRAAEAEDFIAKTLHRLSSGVVRYGINDVSSLLEQVEAKLSIKLAPQQKRAVYQALENGVMVLTGGPGTGKTTIVKALISLFDSVGERVVLAAPTGRAAKRMSEATGHEAKTVHRMLEMERTQNGESRFSRNAKTPLDESVVIVDEASMLDLFLMEALVRALKRGARLVLIGDSDQLPSVGAGNILDDIISSERISTVRLTEIFRQSKESLIITNAHRINSGEAPILNVTDNDFFFVRREKEGDICATIASLISQRLPKTYGVNIKDQIQVITPSKKGAGGVEALNMTLQETMNPPLQFKREKAAHGTIFREGDRVMQMSNNYELEWEKNGIEGLGLFNGDIGKIIKINKNESYMTIDFEDKLVKYPFDLLDELELAYAITVHKSQGSEYPVVIIPMYSCPPMLMSRNLLYTAVTRAKRMVILVGRSDIPLKMAQNNREVLRYTTLRQRICDYY